MEPAERPFLQVPSPSSSPAKATFSSKGLKVTELANGKVVLSALTVWNAPLEVTYETCAFYREDQPTVMRQVSPEDAPTLLRACASTGEAE